MPPSFGSFLSSLRRSFSSSKRSSPSSNRQTTSAQGNVDKQPVPSHQQQTGSKDAPPVQSLRPQPAHPSGTTAATVTAPQSSNMAGSITQYQLTSQGGPFESVAVPKPVPGDEEVCIRTRAIGLNPLDWKSRAFGVMIQSWPTVLGVDVAGVVESVGGSVKGFKAGDEVYALAGMSSRAGAFQEIVTVPAVQVARKPAALSFEQASTLPICYLTAATCVVEGLKVPLPHLDSESAPSTLQSVLVIGGSSAVGSNAIQLLRLALPHATILTTSSAEHHAHLRSLGATHVFERTAQADPSAIKAATPNGAGVDAILDAVAVAGSQPSIFDALSASGPRLYAYPMAGQPIQVPQGVNGTLIFGRKIFGAKGGFRAMPALTQLLEDGKYHLPTPVETFGKGFEVILPALDKLKAGTSGRKYAVAI